MRFILGAFIASLALITWHIWGNTWLLALFSHGDNLPSAGPKQKTYRTFTKGIVP